MEDEFEKHLRILLESCQEYLKNNIKDFIMKANQTLIVLFIKKLALSILGVGFTKMAIFYYNTRKI